MPNIALVLEYDGSGFHGWQRQPGVRTIEEELLKVLRMVLREEVSAIYASGRTDAGVHARAQVVNFHVEKEPDLHQLMHSISSLFKSEISVLEAKIVPDTFHSRKSAKAKQYTYTLWHRECPPVLDRGRSWYIRPPLDIEKMQHAAKALMGKHDFTSFRASGCGSKNPVKEIFESEVIYADPYVYYQVIGSGFLKQMVRNIVGTLVGIGKGSLDECSMEKILELKDRRFAGVTAPAYGLCLDWVSYE